MQSYFIFGPEKESDSMGSHSERQSQGWRPGFLAPGPGLLRLSLFPLPTCFISDVAAAAAALQAEEFWP